ncbi:hypothetical protein SBRCBS47491_009313 [Sporothrix bragantina]|uniref:NodB homology domain-containing protein n=1 Tax=Sporothrix bragantina TaxID=671064 RepID=A0ABP0CWF1_9PEZI
MLPGNAQVILTYEAKPDVNVLLDAAVATSERYKTVENLLIDCVRNGGNFVLMHDFARIITKPQMKTFLDDLGVRWYASHR